MPAIVAAGQGLQGALPDIGKLIFAFAAEETPYFSTVSKGDPPSAEITQEPADTPGYINPRGVRDATPAPAATNQSEGYGLLESNSHWIHGTVGVGKKAELLNSRAGVGHKKLFAREVVKALKALKTSADRVLCDDVDQRDEGANGSETRGFGSWVQATAQSVRPVMEQFRTPAASVNTTAWANITEETIQDIVQSISEKHGSQVNLVGLFGPALRRKVSNWMIWQPDKSGHLAVRQFQSSGVKDRILRAVVDILECDLGRVELHTSYNLAWSRDWTPSTTMTDASRRRGLFYPVDSVKLRCAQEPAYEALPNDGGGKRGMVDCIISHCVQPTLCGKLVPA